MIVVVVVVQSRSNIQSTYMNAIIPVALACQFSLTFDSMNKMSWSIVSISVLV